ncbi:MAG: hypothetical protein P9M05_05920 [Candidatus Stygibacter australis]|nr:hypothetical protein [Candidatus Stygibacter australis]
MIPDGIKHRIGNLEVNAFSVASWASWLAIPSWNIILDIGLCLAPMQNISRLYISNLNEEHYQGLSMWLRRVNKIEHLGIPQIYIHKKNVKALRTLIDAMAIIQNSSFHYEIIGLQDGDKVKLDSKKTLTVFEISHNIPALGCLIAESGRHLKKDCQHLNADDIKKSIKEGIDIFDIIEKPLLTYISNANPKIFDSHPELLNSETMITGCNSFDNFMEYDPIVQNNCGKGSEPANSHIRPLAIKLANFQGKNLVFCHVPSKFTHCDIYAFLLPRLPISQRGKLSILPYRNNPAGEQKTHCPSIPNEPLQEIEPKLLSPSSWEIKEYPGYFGYRKSKLHDHFAEKYGTFQIAWEVNGQLLQWRSAMQLYEDAYYQFLKRNHELTDWLLNTAADIYDTSPGNVGSGINYEIQDPNKPNHYHDIAIRRSILRLNKWFKGDHLVEIRGLRSEGYTLNPGIVPFHKPELIHQPEYKANWIIPKSIESFWQSNKVIITPKSDRTSQ